MKILLYSEGKNLFSKSGVGKALEHQKRALGLNGIEYTQDPNDSCDIVHINTIGISSWKVLKKAKKKTILVINKMDLASIAQVARAMELYKNDETPVRGQLKVHLRSLESEGANGVIGSVLTYLLGAAGSGGFKGLAGQFSRNYLIEYGVDQSCQIIIERLDTSRRVGIDYHPQHVPSDPNVSHLLKKVIDQTSSVEETKLLHDLWNTRVSKLLIDEKDNLNIYALSVF